MARVEHEQAARVDLNVGGRTGCPVVHAAHECDQPATFADIDMDEAFPRR